MAMRARYLFVINLVFGRLRPVTNFGKAVLVLHFRAEIGDKGIRVPFAVYGGHFNLRHCGGVRLMNT